MKRFSNLQTFFLLLVKALPLLWQAAPSETSILTFVLLVQGLIPAVTLYLTKLTVDEVIRLANDTGSLSIVELSLMWVFTLLLGIILVPVAQVLQGNVAEKFTAHVNLELMRKAVQVLPVSLLSIAVGGSLFTWAVWRASLGLLTVGAVVVIIQALAQVQSVIGSLIEGVGTLFERGLYFKHYFDLMAAKPRVALPENPRALATNTTHHL